MDADMIERLEVKLAFLERATNELSDAVYRQRQDIVQLTERLVALSSRFESLQASERPRTPEEERPPHY